MPRTRRQRSKIVALALAGFFIVLLFLEVVAIFSPALIGIFQGKAYSYSVVVFAPPSMEQRAVQVAKDVASRLGVENYRIEPVEANITSGLMSIVLFVNDEPVLVLFTSSTQGVGEVVYQIATQLLPHVPDNATLLYAGSAGSFLLPKNMTLVEEFVRDIIASQPPHGSTPAETNTTQG
ncbi:MAG TPA: hypothetical protein EYH50_03415 [Pyrodictium delaneyi]|uniref:Uncharacterized protein n=1 Tax=Pyrodictium delaneyi TaxID=1273541 RepID=A0A833EAY3_9CREN|nr:hypothetical protein [Pyrodictium delaneyi]